MHGAPLLHRSTVESLDGTESCRGKFIVQSNLTHSLSAKTLLLALLYRRFIRAVGGQLSSTAVLLYHS
jgi:hypothetical protein